MGAGATDFEEIDLRAEDDALIAAELEAAEIEAERLKAEAPPEEEDEDEDEDEEESETDSQDAAPKRRRSRRDGGGHPFKDRIAADAQRAPTPARSRAPSTMARRDTACGSTPPCRTTRSTPSTGPASARSRSSSRRTASSFAARVPLATTDPWLLAGHPPRHSPLDGLPRNRWPRAGIYRRPRRRRCSSPTLMERLGPPSSRPVDTRRCRVRTAPRAPPPRTSRPDAGAAPRPDRRWALVLVRCCRGRAR